MFFTAYVLCSLSLVKLKTEDQTKQKTSSKRYNTQIQVLANPGLA